MTVRTGFLFVSAGLALILAACQAVTRRSETASLAPDDYSATYTHLPPGTWRSGDSKRYFDRREQFAEQEEEEEGEHREMGPPPPGYWRILGNEVPNWTPEMMHQRDGGPYAWTSIGPKPITNEFWSGEGDASGRVVSIAPHPLDPNTVYIASASGGIWKTTDAGATWLPLTDELASLAHGAVAVSLSNPDIVIAGTGEYTTRSQGGGIFRSVDAGASWERIGATLTVGSAFSGIAIHPTNPDIIHITTSLGYRRTVNGGLSWQAATTGLSSGACSSLVMDPFDPDTIYVAKHNVGIFKSVDGGVTMTQQLNGLPLSGITRIVMATCASDSKVLYAAFIDEGAGLQGLYRTTNGGLSWTKLGNTPNFPLPQGWYNVFVGVSPNDPNTVYCGGVHPYAVAGIIKSTDGGGTWTDITRNAHPDQHAIAFGPTGTIWVGNDGGVFKSDDEAATWLNCNSTLTITQHYNLAPNPNDLFQILGGTQDNGTPMRVDGSLAWPQVIAGDGGPAAFDFLDSTRFYTTYVYLTITRFTSSDARDITGPWGGASDPQETVNFIAPLVMDPNNPQTLLGGTYRPWRTQNAGATFPQWGVISNFKFDSTDALNTIAVAKGNSNVIYCGSSGGNVYVTTDGGATWDRYSREDVDPEFSVPEFPAEGVTDIMIDPRDTDGSTAYISFIASSGPRIFKTTNYGERVSATQAGWASVTGALATGARINCIAADWFPTSGPVVLFAGSGAGVYSSTDDGAVWTKDGPELPNVNCQDLFVDSRTGIRTVTAATYGRGMWQAPLEGGPCQQPAISAGPSSRTACIGELIAFSATATGTGLNYQWFHNDVAISGAASATYTITSAVAEDEGTYKCRVFNTCGEAFTLPATLDLSGITVVTQPESQSICEGELLVSFCFEVESDPPATYKWFKGGVEIPGATQACLLIFSPTQADAGSYTCEARNSCNVTTSRPATLAVGTIPHITTQPQSAAVPEHQSVTFFVQVTGTPPPTFQWYKNDNPIAGATASSYTITDVDAGDVANYRVVVTNSCGSVISDPALLTIGGCPADLTGDGVIDFGDYLEFLNLYDALDPRVDYNMDGVIDFLDYLEFLNYFDAGC